MQWIVDRSFCNPECSIHHRIQLERIKLVGDRNVDFSLHQVDGKCEKRIARQKWNQQSPGFFYHQLFLVPIQAGTEQEVARYTGKHRHRASEYGALKKCFCKIEPPGSQICDVDVLRCMKNNNPENHNEA